MRERRQVAAFTLLYAAEGAPIGFIWWALPALLRSEGVPIERITSLTAVLLLPWVFKFLWAPLVDALRSRRWGFRAWILSAQLGMAAALAPLMWLDPAKHFDTWCLLLLAHAFAAATQDVAIDALAINSVAPARRGLLNGCMQAGMLSGRSLFGGGALVLASWAGPSWMMAALVAWILLAMPAALLVDEPTVTGATGRGAARELRAGLTAMLATRSLWIGLGFALISAAGFEATGQLAGPFLVDRGVGTATVGVFFGLVVVGAMLAGGLLGGRLSDRWGRLRSVAVFLGGFVVAILLVAAADRAGAPALAHLALLGAMYFCVGLFTAASYALFMDLTLPRLAGTQFSTFMAATNACESWSALAGGRLAASAGYPSAFVVMSLVSVCSLPLLALIGRDARLQQSSPSHP